MSEKSPILADRTRRGRLEQRLNRLDTPRCIHALSLALSAGALLCGKQAWPSAILLLLLAVSTLVERKAYQGHLRFLQNGLPGLWAVCGVIVAMHDVSFSSLEWSGWFVRNACWLAVLGYITTGISLVQPSAARVFLLATSLGMAGMAMDLVSVTANLAGERKRRLSSQGPIWYQPYRVPIFGTLQNQKFGSESLLLTAPHTYVVTHYPNDPREYFHHLTASQIEFEKNWELFAAPYAGCIQIADTVKVTSFESASQDEDRLRLSSRAVYAGKAGDRLVIHLHGRSTNPTTIRLHLLDQAANMVSSSIAMKHVDLDHDWKESSIELRFSRDAPVTRVSLSFATQMTSVEFVTLTVDVPPAHGSGPKSSFHTPGQSHLNDRNGLSRRRARSEVVRLEPGDC